MLYKWLTQLNTQKGGYAIPGVSDKEKHLEKAESEKYLFIFSQN